MVCRLNLTRWIQTKFHKNGIHVVTCFMQFNIMSLSAGRLLDPFSDEHNSLCSALLITWIASCARATERP